MYKPGDLIIYSGEGMCRVEHVGPSEIPGTDKDRQYYTIQPLYRDGTIFVPVDTGVFMRPIISRQQAQELICSIPKIKVEYMKIATFVCSTSTTRR